MKKQLMYLPALAIALAIQPVAAHQNMPSFRPESHAPADVMADHMHKKGGAMIGYRHMRQTFSGLYNGSEKASLMEAADAGYTSVAKKMTMDMHMLDIMYALSDNITLMLMPQYMTMDMSMEATPSTTGMMDTHMGEEHGMHAGAHSHEVSGVGDTQIASLIRLYRSGTHKVHGTLGISVPTGSVDEKMANGNFTHYGMQLGSGTWDFTPNLTYTGYSGAISWGAQMSAVLRLEDENDSGFAFGDRYKATGWSAYRIADWASLSLRIGYEKQEDINGHYDGPHNHSSPPDFQANYGGEFIDLGLGVNLVPQSGLFAGVRLGLEWSEPVSEHYNGFQIGRERTLSASLSYGF